MRSRLACVLPLFLVAACGELAPPLEQLPLRDTLRADPEVVAALSDGAREDLAARLLLTRGSESAGDPVDDPAAAPADLVARFDRARERSGQDALLAGVVDGGGVMRSVPAAASAGGADPLPPLEVGGAPAPTLALESRALAGRAQGELRALLTRSGARRLQRVVGWPIGAIAIGDSVYVSAAWLVALAPAAPGDGGADAGAAAPTTPATGTAAGEIRAQAAPQSETGAASPPPYDGGVAIVSPLYSYDSGVYTPPPPQQPPPPPPVDDCAAACASSSSSSDDCSSSGQDDCGSSDDGSADCSGSSDDGSGCETSDDEGEGCQVARGRRPHGKGTLLTLAAPLAFLLPRRRR